MMVPDRCSVPDCPEPPICGVGEPGRDVEWLCAGHFAEAMKAIGERVSFLVRRIAAAAANGGRRTS